METGTTLVLTEKQTESVETVQTRVICQSLLITQSRRSRHAMASPVLAAQF